VLLDVGANVDCTANNLEQFAVMGDIYCRSIFGMKHPRVGLLSIGEEEGKGNELTRTAFQLLKRLPINFIATSKAATYTTDMSTSSWPTDL